MDKQDQFFEEPGLDGPDYVALVIEWDELADQIENEITEQNRVPVAPRTNARTLVVAALGALGVLGVAWAIHRLRAA